MSILFLVFFALGVLASCSQNIQTGAVICSADNSQQNSINNNQSGKMIAVENGQNISVSVKFGESGFNKEIEVQNRENNITIVQGNVSIKAQKPIRIRKIGGISRMLVRNPTGVEVAINVTPKEAVEKIKEKATEEKMELNMSDIKIDTDGNTPIYKTVAKKPAKFLGLIPITVPIDVTVNAQTEEVTVKPPFWAFLVSFT